MTDIQNIVEKQHRFFKSGKTKDTSFRLRQLKKLKRILQENEQEIFDALDNDFKKPAYETYATELGILYMEINHLTGNLEKWAKPQKVSGSIINFPSTNYIYSEPYGVSLVIGAWNYPLQLSLNPVLGSIAAGNCTIIKPSELAPNTSSLLAEIINKRFDEGYLKVVEGAAETTQALLSEPLDHIFFTGSTRVGKIIMKAAAEQLTPVTLELGGKSPAIVDKTADIHSTAKRIAWGKFVNAGQTCVASDYVYVHESVKESFLKTLKEEITKFYGSDPKKSPDYARIINEDHFNRLKQFLNNGNMYMGGPNNEEELYIAPTILTDITWDDPIMQEEIFGPILPILSFGNMDEVIDTLQDKPKPLALYIFSEDAKNQQKIISSLSFGGGCINDTVAHLGNHNLPFGGIGNSGIGNYHGKASFDTFSHQKSIMEKTTWFDNPLRYPPYNGALKWLKKLIN
ncbi:MAG: aldehyde dehydrogenase [Balneolaceae bacterium]|nr:aldehyde dehydrogenase [Balneolaceae bacterium]